MDSEHSREGAAGRLRSRWVRSSIAALGAVVVSGVVGVVGLASPAFAVTTSQGGNGATLRGVVNVIESAPGGGSGGGCGGSHTS
ncbi:MAG: hypothetical protein ACYCV7_14355, partial [Acidimicrobiales bacterium]